MRCWFDHQKNNLTDIVTNFGVWTDASQLPKWIVMIMVCDLSLGVRVPDEPDSEEC